MWTLLVDVLNTLAAQPWLDPAAQVARALSSLIGLVVVTDRAVRYACKRRRRR